MQAKKFIMTAMRRFSGDKPEKRNTSGKSTTGKSGKPYKRDNEKPWRSDKPASDRPKFGRSSESSDKPFRRDDAAKDSWRNKERSSDNSWSKNNNTDNSAEKPKRSFDKPWQKDRNTDDRPPRKEYSDRKPFRSDDNPSERKPWSNREKSGDRPWKKREESGDKPWKKREESGDRSWNKRDESGDKPWKKREVSDDKPWIKREESGDKPWRKREDSADKPWRKREDSGDRPFNKREASGDRPWKKREDSSDNRGHKSEDRTDKPWINRKSEGDSGWKRKERSFDKPESTERRTDSRYKRPESDSERRPYKSDWKDKPRDNERSSKSEGYRGRGERSDSRKPYRSSGTDNSKPILITDGPMRLNKFIANAGVCSRREADDMILAGAVTVNGVVVTELGTKVTRDDKVQYDGETLTPQNKVYLLLNKPKGVITTLDDPLERNTVINLVKNACEERIYPVGRLDRNTSGLLLMTNDGDLAKKLTHPSHRVRKIYHVELNKSFAKSDMVKLAEGIELEDGIMAVDEIAYTGTGEDKKSLGVIIHSGKNRVVRRLFEALDYEVTKLDRVAFANLTKKDLPRGKWRFLEESEINVLKML